MQSKKITKVQNQGPNDQLISQSGPKLGIDGLVGNVARDPASAGVSPELTILRKKKGQTDLDESEIFSSSDLVDSASPYSEQSILVAQLEGAGALGAGTASGAGVTATGTSLAAGAAGAGGAAGAVTGASSALAATSAAAATTTTLATATSAMSVGQVAGLSAGVAAAAGGGGGGGGSVADPAPAPLPPANPFPGTDPSADPNTIDPTGGSGSTGTPVHRLALSEGLPTDVLNKTLVIDLGVNFGPYQQTLYYTEKVDGQIVTRAISFRDISNVSGTILNDQISGHSGANTLDGGAGEDIIYGAGGADILRGGANLAQTSGSLIGDWVLFKPLTRAGGAGVYDAGVVVNLSTGLYTTAVSGTNLEASGFEHVVGSDGDDTITGDYQNNILDGAGGDDWIDGGAGLDQIFGGASNSVNGNQMIGGADADSFWVGYNINPVARSTNASLSNASNLALEIASHPSLFNLTNQSGISMVANASVIRDWASGTDSLNVSSLATAVIGGLDSNKALWDAARWAGNDLVDLRTNVTNQGTIVVAAGAATIANNIYLSSGRDHVYTGYELTATQATDVIGSSPTSLSSGTSTDLIWGWDIASGTRDSLTVASGDTAVIASLVAQNPSSATRWDASDTIDLRTNVNNLGTIVVSTGVGNNTVYGSIGVEHIYGGAGSGNLNQIWAGAGADQIFVGATRLADAAGNSSANAIGTPVTTSTSRDLIWDWEQGTDVLTVYGNGIAVLAGRMSPNDWSGNDTVSLSTGVNNSGVVVIALGDGNDTLSAGSSGVDYIYGGAGNNSLSGGAGNDHFYTGFNYNPLTDTRSELSVADGTAIDRIQDWENTDQLTVGSRGQTIITGMSTAWSLNNTIDVSHATNNGVIRIAAGGVTSGVNQITLSGIVNEGTVIGGVDQIYVGSEFDSVGALSGTGLNATDVIYRWDDQTTKRDQLDVAAGSRAVIASLLNPADWSGNNLIDLRSQVDNRGLIQLAAGRGLNTIYGSSGSDHYYVGYTNNSSGVAVVDAAAATDAIYGWDAQRWNQTSFPTGALSTSTDSSTFNLTGVVSPRVSKWNGSVDDIDGYDRLHVALGSTARIASLHSHDPVSSTRWDGVDEVDLRSNVVNYNYIAADGGGIEIWTGAANDYIYGSSGRDFIYSGPGLDNVWGGDGNDIFYVGHTPSSPDFSASAAAAAEPRIWDWQNANGTSATVGSAASPGDGLRIASDSFAMIQGLWGMNSSDTKASRWQGNDIADFRWDVANNGIIAVETMDGNDTVYGSSGNDYINPGAGRNLVDITNGGSDRIYLDNFKTQTQVYGFDLANDKIYLDTRVLESFKTAKGITTPSTYNVLASQYEVGGLDSGQTDNPGNLFPLSKVVFNSVYNGELSNYGSRATDPDGVPSYGWNSNGAYNNSVYSSIHPLAATGVAATAQGFLALGNGLSMIPIVGPLLAIGPWVISGLMFADAGLSKPYLNREYDGVVLDSGAAVLSLKDNTISTSISAWDLDTGATVDTDQRDFLDFYNVYNSTREYARSLEFTSQQGGDVAGDYDTLQGVASYLAVYTNTETFIYLVASKDGLIQDNEAILIAQVEGHLTNEHLVMYNGGTDTEYLRYFNNSIAEPAIPPEPTLMASGVSALDGNGVMLKTSFKPASLVKTEGSTGSVTESNAVRFADLRAGEKVSIAGLTYTASVDTVGADVAAAFDAYPTVSTGFTGSLTGWSMGAASSNQITFTSTTPSANVTDLSETVNRQIRYLTSSEFTSLQAASGVSGVGANQVLTDDGNLNIRIDFDKRLTSRDTLEVYVNGVLSTTYSGHDPARLSNLSAIATVDGVGSGFETATVTFKSLAQGESVSVGGLVYEALTAKTSTEVAAAFGAYNASNSATTVGFTGSLVGWTKGAASGSQLMFTSTTAGNVANLTEDLSELVIPVVLSASVLPTVTTADGTSSSRETATVVFQNLKAGQSLTIANLTYTPTVDKTAAQVAAAFDAYDAGTTTDFTGTLTGWTMGSAAGSQLVFSSTDPTGNVANLSPLLEDFKISVKVISPDFDSNAQIAITYDSTAPVATDFTISASDTKLFVADSGNHPGSAVLDVSAVTGAPSDQTVSMFDSSTGDGKLAEFTLTPSSVASTSPGYVTATIKVTDLFGRTTSLSDTVAIGSDSNDLIGHVGGLATDKFIFGFGGADTIRVGHQGASIYGGDGIDSIFGGNGSDSIYGGLGADNLSGGLGADTFHFAIGESTTTAYDVIADIGLADDGANKDTIDLVEALVIAANTSGVNGTDAGSIRSHSITAGLISFDDDDLFASAITPGNINTMLSNVITYLESNITGEGQVVAFNSGSDAYLFQNNTDGDVFIKFSSIQLAGLTSDASLTSTDYLYVI